jgi:hypothetical protein
LRASGALSHKPNSVAAGASGAVLVTALAVAEGIAVIAFIGVLAMARPQRLPKDEDAELWRPPFPWWAKTLGVLVALAALISPFVVLFGRKSRKNNPIPLLRHAPITRIGTGTLTQPGAGSFWPVIVGMVVAILVVLTLTFRSRRRRRRAYVRPGNRDRRITALLDGLTAGSDALAANSDPRTAIIACYAAMERGFAAAGSSPAASDTPAEVLARAAAADMIRSGAAETLTALFRRARYSTEPMTSADSAAAASALTQMRVDLQTQQDRSAEPAGARP